MRCILLLSIGLCAFFSSQAQIKDGFKWLESQEFEQAARAFREDLGKGKKAVVARYGLGLLYADEAYPQRQADSAYFFLSQAYSDYRTASTGKKRKYQKWGLSPGKLNRVKGDIEEAAWEQAEAAHTLEAYDFFLEKFEDAPRRLRRKAERAREQKSLELLAETQDLNIAQQLFETLTSGRRRLSGPLFEEGQRNLFHLYIAEEGWESFPAFMEKYPDNPYVTDPARDDFLNIRTSGQASLFEEFFQQHPGSLYAPIAQDSTVREVFQLLQNEDKLEAFTSFILTYPNSGFLARIDPYLYKAFRKTPNRAMLEEALATTNPALFPNTLEVLYEIYAYSGEVSPLNRFREKYPDFHQMDRLQKDLDWAGRYEELLAELQKGTEAESLGDRWDDLVREAAPKYKAFRALQQLIRPDVESEQWSDALILAESYEEQFGNKSTAYQQLLTLLRATGTPMVIETAGDSINTSAQEYSPVLSSDGERLYFCQNKGGLFSSDENVLVATRLDDGWTRATVLPPFEKPAYNESPLSISNDGTRLLLFENGRLIQAVKTAEGWRSTGPLGDKINSGYWQGDACFTADGRGLIFASKREDTQGAGKEDIDLYISWKNSRGEWQDPINLGPQINTPLFDRSPFLHPDQKTLYFSSSGHGGIGDLDVFKIQRLDDTWTRWSQPVHLGKAINTSQQDWGFKVTTNGDRAYFSAGNTNDNSDIYFVDLPQELRPERVATVKGVLLDPEDEPVDAQIVIEDLDNDQVVATFQSDPQTGRFFVTLPQGKLYSYRISKEGYLEQANHIDLTQDATELDVDEGIIRMIPLPGGEEKQVSFTLRNLFFDTDKFTLKEASFSQLDRLADLLKENTDFRIRIEGHTDDEGAAAYNQQLSTQRAKAVFDYLTEKGVPASRMKYKGFGESQPVSDNATAPGRAQNRRVEIVFE